MVKKVIVLMGIFLVAIALAGGAWAKDTPTCARAEVELSAGQYQVELVEKVNAPCGYSETLQEVKGYYNGRVVSYKGETLGYFRADQIDATICVDSSDPNVPGGCMPAESGLIRLQVPLFPNGSKAILYDPTGKQLLEINLAPVSSCNENKKCETGEDNATCPSDCKGGSNVPPKTNPPGGTTMSPGQPNTGSPADPSPSSGSPNASEAPSDAEKKNSIWIWIAAALGVLFLSGAVIIYIRHKRFKEIYGNNYFDNPE